jgi:hypothetical protein
VVYTDCGGASGRLHVGRSLWKRKLNAGEVLGATRPRALVEALLAFRDATFSGRTATTTGINARRPRKRARTTPNRPP